MERHRDRLPAAQQRRLDAICDRYENELKAGRASPIEAVVADAPAALAAALREELNGLAAEFPSIRSAPPGLWERLAELARHAGAPIRTAIRSLLKYAAPDLGPIVDCIDAIVEVFVSSKSFDEAESILQSRSHSPAQRRRIEEMLAVIANDLRTLVAQLAPLAEHPGLARRVYEAALTQDADYRKSVAKLTRLARAADEPVRQPPPAAPAAPSPRPKAAAIVAVQSAPTVVLEVTAGPHQGLRREFAGGDTVVVGRGAGATFQLLDDPHFSRNHLLLEILPPRVHLRDLKSTYGTKVNGKVVAERLLNDGDEISGGRTTIRISIPADAQEPTTNFGSTSDFDPSENPSTRIEAKGFAAGASSLPSFIPGFQFLRLLGQGGMGAVYLARREADGEECAIKLLLPESSASERAMKLFLREISVVSQLSHPRIVRFKEMGMACGQFFFAMEYVQTTPARSVLRSRPAEYVRLACTIACQALEGLAYAHSLGFVHRDVKPANLLIDHRSGRPETKVSDFGLAKNFQNAGFSGMTLAGQTAGTLAFMAPEQILHCRDAKPAVDIYSMGATLYSLLADRLPLDMQVGDPIRAVLEQEPAPLAQFCPDVPAGLAAAIHRSMAKDPSSRPADAAEFRQLLLPFAAAIL